jgi:hypothetical protein
MELSGELDVPAPVYIDWETGIISAGNKVVRLVLIPV